MVGLIGLIGALLVTIVIVALVEFVSRTPLPYGWLGNIVVGFIGGFIGQVIIPGPDLWLFGVPVFKTFLGALIFILVA
ncbi:MAG: hypothetical protein D6791_15340, partial [Chloroflexi bacterium]